MNINTYKILLKPHFKLIRIKSLIKVKNFDKNHKRYTLNVQNTSNEEIKLASAKSAIEKGLEKMDGWKDAKGAIELFEEAMELNPGRDEARAAIYNIACCQAKLKNWEASAKAVESAVNNYGLKLNVALEDDDLEELRNRREWVDLYTKVKGGMSETMKTSLTGELRTPFRFVRLWIFGGLALGAALGLFIIALKLIASVQKIGGEALNEGLKNFGINSAIVLVLGFLFNRDLKERNKLAKVINREEKLGNLLIEINPDKIIPLMKMRGIIRPVIIFGSKTHIQKSIKTARSYFNALRERGISIIGVTIADPSENLRELKEKLKKEKKLTKTGFGEEIIIRKEDNKWELTPAETDEWREWLEEQRTISGEPGPNFYVQIQLNGTVRSSGSGMPPWSAFVSDIPPLDSIQTKFSDNIGT